jgi:hypothetical protein
MVIRGLLLTNWFGWFSGTLLLHKPWGHPKAKPFLCINFLWFCTLFVTLHIVYLDWYHYFKTRENDEVNVAKVSKFLDRTIIVAYYLIFIAIQGVLKFRAVELAELLSNFQNMQYAQRRSWKLIWILAEFVINLSYGVLIATTVNSWFIAAERDWRQSWFSGLGQTGHNIFITLIGNTYSNSASLLSFALITSIVLHLGMTFEQFCEELEQEYVHYLKVKGDLEIEWLIPFVNSFRGVIIAPGSWRKRLDEMEKLFETARCVTDPLVFCTLPAAIFRMITGGYGIVFNKYDEDGDSTTLIWNESILITVYAAIKVSLVIFGQFVQDVVSIFISL